MLTLLNAIMAHHKMIICLNLFEYNTLKYLTTYINLKVFFFLKLELFQGVHVNPLFDTIQNKEDTDYNNVNI